jgi:ribonuclease G
MSEEILVNVTPREVRVALVENGLPQEVYVERGFQQSLLGNIYKGRILRLLPGIQAAFVDIGLERSAFLHVSDIAGYEALVNKGTQTDLVDIRDILRVGQDLLVQVYKEPLGSKGARLTTQFTLPSRYLVLTPGVFQISVSHKLTNESERQRLLMMVQPGEHGGYIFRTAAEGAAQIEIENDKEFVNTLWSEIKNKAQKSKPGEMVYEEIPVVLRVLRDVVGYQVERIRVDSTETVRQMQDFAARYVPVLKERIEFYPGDRPIFDIYGVEDEIQKALERKVNLKSGGYLVIDQTEAMTTIDVNSGSYTGHSNLEQTIFKINLEAIDVIARQVRLRNIGGIIIIDFIDMEDPLHKEHLLQSFIAALSKDNARTEVSELSSLGLVQMTRKRTRESLEHILCVPCPLCYKRGFIKSYATLAYEIFREIKRSSQLSSWMGFLVVASQGVIDYLLEEESSMLAELEAQLGKPIRLQAETSYTQECYDILPWSEKE